MNFSVSIFFLVLFFTNQHLSADSDAWVLFSIHKESVRVIEIEHKVSVHVIEIKSNGKGIPINRLNSEAKIIKRLLAKQSDAEEITGCLYFELISLKKSEFRYIWIKGDNLLYNGGKIKVKDFIKRLKIEGVKKIMEKTEKLYIKH